MSQQILNFDSGTNESLQKIFTAMLACRDNIDDRVIADTKEGMYNECRSIFDSKFPINIFFNEYYFIYQVYKESKIKLFSVEQLVSLIDANSTDILKSPFINTSDIYKIDNGNIVDDAEKIAGFTQEMVKRVKKLSNKIVSIEEFESACNIYLNSYKNALMTQIANSMSMIMQSTGFDEELKRGGRKHWQGREDAIKYYNLQMMKIRALDENNATRAIQVNEDWVTEENSKDKDPSSAEEVILDYGISRIDNVAGGIRRTNLIEILGATKGGKTTFTAYLVERALSRGLNVAIWPLEGTYQEWMGIILSLTIKHSNDGEGPVVNRGHIVTRNYRNEEERKLVAAAREVVASPERGKLTFISGSAYIEDYLDVIQNHYETENKFDVIVMDSPLLVLSKNGKGKVERIGECYTTFKDYVANKVPGGVVGIVTAQLKQEVINELRSNPEKDINETAGGESSETIRTPDEIIGLFSSKLERSNGQIKIYDVASRHHEAFENFYAGCNFACGDFFDNEALNE